jgi:transglutaminase-like putative cysteine protease
MNIPSRYCTGYLGDVPSRYCTGYTRRHRRAPPCGPMDFAGWLRRISAGQWYSFGTRNRIPRIGRVLIARGRDAADVAISNTFGPNTLVIFKIYTDEVAEAR